MADNNSHLLVLVVRCFVVLSFVSGSWANSPDEISAPVPVRLERATRTIPRDPVSGALPRGQTPPVGPPVDRLIQAMPRGTEPLANNAPSDKGQYSDRRDSDGPQGGGLWRWGELLPPQAYQAPVRIIDVMLGPVREANLLLPTRLDPFHASPEGDLEPGATNEERQDADRTWLPSLLIDESAAIASFDPSRQKQRLGALLATRVDTPVTTAPWIWQAQAGGSFRQGVSSNTNLQGTFQVERHTRRGDLLGKLGAIYNRNDSDTNSRIFGEALWDRNLRGHWIGYAREEVEYDQARRIDLRSVTSAGIGFKFLDTLEQRLVTRTGPTLSFVAYSEAARDRDEIRGGWLVEAEYRRALGEAARFEWTGNVLPNFDSEDQVRVRNEAAIQFPLGGKASPWNWRFGVRHEFQLNPVRDTATSDFQGFFTITYSKK